MGRVLHNVELTDESPIGSGLYVARDNLGMLRAHDGSYFKGYVNSWGGDRWQACWFDPSIERFRHSRRFKTRKGAERKMCAALLAAHTESRP